MRLGLTLVLALTPLVKVPSDTCISCHENAAPDSHPYAIVYRAKLYGESQIKQATAPSGFGSTIEQDFLVEGRIECTSCHASHEQEIDSRFRLRLPGENATPLCVACHVLER